MLGKNPGKSPFERIEARLQSLIEGSLSVLVSWGSIPQTLAHALANAMHSGLQLSQDGHQLAPGSYTIQVNPERLPYWQADPMLLEIVGQHFTQAAREEGIIFSAGPTLLLAIDPALPLNGVRVLASSGRLSLADTAAFKTPSDAPHPLDNIPLNAFLIVNGSQTFPLRQAVINIGRRLDNHVSIDDPRVSRTHAQLRAIHGSYVIFDLKSTGGTYVNGQRITQYNLNPGDVISLAGVPIIYGQESLNQANRTVQKLPPGTTQNLRKPVDPAIPKKRHP